MDRGLRRLLRRQGLTAAHIKTTPGYLHRYGFRPDIVVDVGVHDGTPYLYKSFPEAEFVLVDPLPGSAEAVAQGTVPRRYSFHAIALGAEPGRATLTVPTTKPGKGSKMASLMKRIDSQTRFITGTQEIGVDVTTLDTLMADRPGRCGLKIDTEGYELEVLQGAGTTLERCEFVILELSVTKRFEGLAPPSAVIRTLASHGLELRDSIDGTGSAQPRHIDVLFTRWA